MENYKLRADEVVLYKKDDIITDDGQKIDINTLKLLSSDGSEVIVYHDDNLTYKIFRDNYRFSHKTANELDAYLNSIGDNNVRLAVNGACPVDLVNKGVGAPPSADEIVKRIEELI